jgi:hypothetical protein
MIKEIKLKEIKKNKNNKIKRTNSFWFLLPMLELSISRLKKFGLINCYLDDNLNNYGHNKCLHLLFSYSEQDLSKFNDYLDLLSKHKLFIDLYDTEGHGDVMIIFKIPDEHLPILDLFLQGKYSEFPLEFKTKFFKEKSVDGAITEEWKILNKHEDMRKFQEIKTGVAISEEWEVWDIPVPEEEIYVYNKNILNTIS